MIFLHFEPVVSCDETCRIRSISFGSAEAISMTWEVFASLYTVTSALLTRLRSSLSCAPFLISSVANLKSNLYFVEDRLLFRPYCNMGQVVEGAKP